MHKLDVRKLYWENIKNISLEEHKEKSENIASLFFSKIDLTQLRSIHVFLPILKNKEINTWNIINQIWKLYPPIKVIVSKSDFTSLEMVNYLLTPNDELVINKMGIPEPIHQNIDQSNLDLILIPLLGFDKRGNRVGYGKGFYDRFLQKYPKVIRIGLSFFDPVNQIEDNTDLDIALHYVITPTYFWNFCNY